MANQTYSNSTMESRMLRIQAGDYVKQLRIASGMTQRELADHLNLKHYTFVSQFETGHGRLPPSLVIKCAEALGQEPRDFAMKMLSFYDPMMHQALIHPTKKSSS